MTNDRGQGRPEGTQSDRPVRTSKTHPLRIDKVPAGDAGGLIGITFCPGKCGSAVRGLAWERDLAADLDAIAAWKAEAVVTLIEEHEFKSLGVPTLGDQVLARDIAWHHWPITDVQSPDARFEAAWLVAGKELVDLLRSGGRVLVHCRGGLGRAGTVAARFLVELGVPPRDAIDLVRKARPGAIETSAQLDYILNLPRIRAEPSRSRSRAVGQGSARRVLKARSSHGGSP